MSDTVVISHSTDQATADQVAAALRHADLSVGQITQGNQVAEVSAAISGARSVIVLWSQAAASSVWIGELAERANVQRKLSYVLLDGTPPAIQVAAADVFDMAGGAATERERRLSSITQSVQSRPQPKRAETSASAPSAAAPSNRPAGPVRVVVKNTPRSAMVDHAAPQRFEAERPPFDSLDFPPDPPISTPRRTGVMALALVFGLVVGAGFAAYGGVSQLISLRDVQPRDDAAQSADTQQAAPLADATPSGSNDFAALDASAPQPSSNIERSVAAPLAEAAPPPAAQPTLAAAPRREVARTASLVASPPPPSPYVATAPLATPEVRAPAAAASASVASAPSPQAASPAPRRTETVAGPLEGLEQPARQNAERARRASWRAGLAAIEARGDMQGRNAARLDNGALYEGEWSGGAANGVGVSASSNGQRYSGAWRGSKPHGYGVLTYANGNRYEGEFVNGAPNGRGAFWNAQGERLTGAALFAALVNR